MTNGSQLESERCPHCGIAKPSLNRVFESSEYPEINGYWALYLCLSCRKFVLTAAPSHRSQVEDIWPTAFSVSDTIPARAREFLVQAAASLHAPAGAVMLTASAVDAMLKDKGYKEGVLNSRIDKAAKDHLLTPEMAAWAHEIRLDANDQRHADELADLPDIKDAQKVLEFAQALAQFLYVLPATVERGRKSKVLGGADQSPA
jgi:Domain of unknown function (DUF4145)